MNCIPVWTMRKRWAAFMWRTWKAIEVPDNIKPYFDFEAYGRDISINENGHFAPGGYVTKVSDDFRRSTTGSRTSPLNTGFLLTLSFRSGSRWRLIKKIIDGSSQEGYRKLAERAAMRNDSWHFETLCPEAKGGGVTD